MATTTRAPELGQREPAAGKSVRCPCSPPSPPSAILKPVALRVAVVYHTTLLLLALGRPHWSLLVSSFGALCPYALGAGSYCAPVPAHMRREPSPHNQVADEQRRSTYYPQSPAQNAHRSSPPRQHMRATCVRAQYTVQHPPPATNHEPRTHITASRVGVAHCSPGPRALQKEPGSRISCGSWRLASPWNQRQRHVHIHSACSGSSTSPQTQHLSQSTPTTGVHRVS
eukprot:scaffold3457_cov118-Isochrysis_galbana.AAC.2